MHLFKRKSTQANSAQKRMAPPTRKKVAIVGSGCAGMGAAWALRDTDYEVHIFEKADRLGGHTNTQPFNSGNKTIDVDTGFIVMNTATYPNFIRFLNHIGVEPVNTEMTFGVSRNRGEFEWSGEPQGIFAQRRNIFRPQHWRMIFDIVRFNQFALDILADDDDATWRPGFIRSKRKQAADMTIGEYLDREGYSQAFRDDYLIPMTAAVWSTSPDKASLEFPAKTLIRFMWNHHLLSTLADRPPWLTIPGGSRRYIDAILEQFPKDRLHCHLSCEVANVLRPAAKLEGLVSVAWINAQNGKIDQGNFDHVILACHGDEVLPLLAKHGASKTAPSSSASSTSSKASSFVQSSRGVQYVSEEEFEIFSAFETTANVCYLHSDLALMPTRRATWTAWNYLVTSKPSQLSHPAGVSLTYCMNILQHFPEEQYGPVLVTMNPDEEPKPELTQGKFNYTHPLYTIESVRAQERLEKIQNTRGVSYCGAWTKYGFHEDGFSSGLRVAIEHLGAKLPFEFVDSTYSRGHKPTLIWKDYLLRLFVLLPLLFGIRVLERIMALPVIASIVQLLGIFGARLLNVGEYIGLL
ncbi:hypothetical protein CB0940_01967 [Cercospora beticola]|uniref:Amine oxidase domain-containing protein n=2 Tax=Cercospora beticola TaxID=122368 RepID=A0A2G5I844_CERBT|nr:hypothetical protein CB0940_01967 [Cercospora beticola]PIB00940.1 hypothetical protein CB0940_01967 [Cercospora beticola]CAK1354129.1 unnamed protein product [Cercospora beticola]